MGSINAPMLVDEFGMGMRILKALDIHGDEKSASLNRLGVGIIAETYSSASWNWNSSYLLKWAYKNLKIVLKITPWRKKFIPPRWLGTSSTNIGSIMGIYEYLKKQLWTNCQIEIDLSDILREIVATGEPIKCKGNWSRSLDNMAGRISFHVVDSWELRIIFPKIKWSHQKHKLHHLKKIFYWGSD